MKKMIVIFDLHCDASLPLGAYDAGGGNKYSRNLISLLISKNIPVLYFTIKRMEELEEKVQLACNSFFFRIEIGESSFNEISYSVDNKQKIIDYIDPILEHFQNYAFTFHSIYWISGEIAEFFSRKYNSYFVHTIVSNGKSKNAQGADDALINERCEVEKHIFDATRYIICSSVAEAEDIIQYYSISKEKIVVSGRWIEKEYIYPYHNLEGNPRTYQFSPDFPVHYIRSDFKNQDTNLPQEWRQPKGFLYVGRIHVNKGIRQIISAWGKIYQKIGELMPPLWIVGGTPSEILFFKEHYLEKDSFVEFAEKNTKLVWWGTLSAEGISTLMMKSAALVMHSKYEAGGNVILEAMAHALPVIATPFGYARDYIRHSENGYLVEYDDIEKLSEYMEYFVKQPYLSNYMGRVAANDMLNLVSGNKFIETHLHVYALSCDWHTKELKKTPIPHDSIHTFSHKLVIPDKQYIYHLITQNTNFTVLDICCKGNISNYYLWEIIISTKTIYFYFLYSILNRKCLVNNTTDYIISSARRVISLYKECLCDKNTVYYINKSQGYILLEREVDVVL